MAKREMDLKFFKVYLPCQSSHHLRIPPAFVKQLNDDFPTEATLKDWSGNSWYMEIEEDEDGVFFKHGWETFVQDNSLEHGDFVLFTYDGNSLFDVKVYGINGCIKDEGLANRCTNVEGHTCHNSVCNLKRKSTEGNSTTSTNSTGSCDANKRRSEIVVFKNLEPSIENTNIRRSGRVVKKHLEPSIANANIRRSGRVVSKNLEPSIGNTNKRRSERVVSKNFEPNIANANKRRLEGVVSKNFEPNIATYLSEFPATTNPHFIASFHPLTGRYHLTIPTRFLVKNGIELEPEMMLRDQNGTKWPVKVIVRKDGWHTFGAGWRKFWKENDVKKHDKIRFEFVFLKGKKKRLSNEIPVTIVRGEGQSNED